MLKFQYDAADQIPEGQESLYIKQDNGGYLLEVEGAVAKTRLDEFRENNTSLRGEVDASKEAQDALNKQLKDLANAKTALETQFAGIDLEEIKKMKEEAQKLADKELIDSGKVEELIAARVNKANAASQGKYDDLIKGHKDTLANIEVTNSALTGQLNKLLIDNEIAMAATKYGVAETALTDVMNRGRETFRLEEGKAVAYDGAKVVYADDQVTPLSIDGWVNTLNSNAPHLFAPSAGAGAKPAAKPGQQNHNQNELSTNDKIAAGLKSLK